MPDREPAAPTLADLETRLVDTALRRSQPPYDSSVDQTAASDPTAPVGPLSDQLANVQELLRHPLPNVVTTRTVTIRQPCTPAHCG